MVEPLHEAACRAVMRLAAEDGEIGPALRAYANLYAALDEELDMEPSAATQELVAEIKQGQLGPVVDATREAGRRGTADFKLDELRHAGVPASAAAWISRPSIAVLPFTEYGSPASESFIGDGIAEDAITMLTALPDLLVISRNSTQKYRGVSLDIPAIGRELGVRYICSGTVRRQENRLRVSAELADAELMAVVAAARFQGEITDLFSLQDRITEHILQAIAPHIRHAELQRARNKRTENLDAYDYMLRGSDLLYRLDRTEFEPARELLQRSIELDPNYAAPHAFTALWHSVRVNQGWSPDRKADLAKGRRVRGGGAALRPERRLGAVLVGTFARPVVSRLRCSIRLIRSGAARRPQLGFRLGTQQPRHSVISGMVPRAAGGRRRRCAARLSIHMCFLPRACWRWPHIPKKTTPTRSSGAAGPIPRTRGTLPVCGFSPASLAATGRLEEARQMAEALRRLEPRFQVREFCANYAYRDEHLRDRFARHLVAAGLPE